MDDYPLRTARLQQYDDLQVSINQANRRGRVLRREITDLKAQRAEVKLRLEQEASQSNDPPRRSRRVALGDLPARIRSRRREYRRCLEIVQTGRDLQR